MAPAWTVSPAAWHNNWQRAVTDIAEEYTQGRPKVITKVRVEDAIGMTLAHDVTKVVPGKFKGPAFRRGHVIRRDDIPELLNIGKEHVTILSLEEGEVHEDEAAQRMAAAIMGPGLKRSAPSEGRVDLTTTLEGVTKINVSALQQINLLGGLIVATVHDETVCKEGTCVAGMRIIPLCIREEVLTSFEHIARENRPVISVVPIKLRKIGLIITGNEVSKGRIEDRFSPILHAKVEALGCMVNNETIVPDDADSIAGAILDFQAKGTEVILCSSGMSVDPDDATPDGIRRSGANVRFYGLPVLPGAMFLYANLRGTHILGVPACVLHSRTTALDRLLPVILTGEELTFEDTRRLAHGGLCLKCEQCAYPVCPFCK